MTMLEDVQRRVAARRRLARQADICRAMGAVYYRLQNLLDDEDVDSTTRFHLELARGDVGRAIIVQGGLDGAGPTVTLLEPTA